MPELDLEKLKRSQMAVMLERIGCSMDMFEKWEAPSKMEEDDSEKKSEEDDSEKTSQSSKKIKTAKNEIAIQGVIIVDELADIYAWFFGEDFVTSPKKVKEALAKCEGDVMLKIDSYGGHIKAASSICAMLNEYEGGRIDALVTGWAASAATLVMMQAERLEIAEFAEVMIHRSSGVALGTGKDMKKQGAYMLKNDETYAQAYADKSGKDKKDMLDYMDKTTWFSASEAVEVGLVDAIAAKRKDKEMKGDGEEEETMSAEELASAEQQSFDYLSYLEITQ